MNFKQNFLLAASRRDVRRVECAELGEPFHVRVLSAREQGEAEVVAVAIGKAEADAQVRIDVVRSYRTKLASLYLCDPDGNRLVDRPEELDAVDWRILDRIILEGSGHNARNTPGIDEQKKSSGITPESSIFGG